MTAWLRGDRGTRRYAHTPQIARSRAGVVRSPRQAVSRQPIGSTSASAQWSASGSHEMQLRRSFIKLAEHFAIWRPKSPSNAEGPMVRRLTAGARGIRTAGPPMERNGIFETAKEPVLCERDRRFESCSLGRG